MPNELSQCPGEHEWVIHRTYNSRARIEIIFKHATPVMPELIAIRKLWPEFSILPPGELKRRIGASGRVLLGDFDGLTARSVIAKAKSLGLQVEERDTSFISSLPICRICNIAWLCDDDELVRQRCNELIAKGVPIIPYESD